MAKKKIMPAETKAKLRPAISEEAREGQMIALAMDLVEERLRNGSASSQETTHFLKLGTQMKKLELEKMRKENELLEAKTEALRSAKKIEELYADAIKAFGIYSGSSKDEEL